MSETEETGQEPEQVAEGNINQDVIRASAPFVELDLLK